MAEVKAVIHLPRRQVILMLPVTTVQVAGVAVEEVTKAAGAVVQEVVPEPAGAVKQQLILQVNKTAAINYLGHPAAGVVAGADKIIQ